jgi:hypothetical protein
MITLVIRGKTPTSSGPLGEPMALTFEMRLHVCGGGAGMVFLTQPLNERGGVCAFDEDSKRVSGWQFPALASNIAFENPSSLCQNLRVR